MSSLVPGVRSILRKSMNSSISVRLSAAAKEEPRHNGEKGSLHRALGPKSKLDKFRFFVQFTARYKNLCPDSPS